MIIANPIYDTVFKFLMEDLSIAKTIISVIIGEDIVDLSVKPQEETTFSEKYFLTVFRLDFKAIIKTADGTEKKVLIELQKSKNSFDLQRFRHYLGKNYSTLDDLDGYRVSLPIVPIYFLGFPLSIPSSVLKIGRTYQDLSSGEIIDKKDEFIESLSHDSFVVQISKLHGEMKTKMERILSIFNQKWIFDEDNKWLLQYDEDNKDLDEETRKILKRLSIAAESNQVKEQIKAEETFDDSMDRALRMKEIVIEEKEAVIEQKEAVIEQKEAVIEQKEAVIEQKEAVIEQKEAVIEQKEAVIEQKDIELKEKDIKLLEQQIELEELRKLLAKKD
jgi:hypothetical protein